MVETARRTRVAEVVSVDADAVVARDPVEGEDPPQARRVDELAGQPTDEDVGDASDTAPGELP